MSGRNFSLKKRESIHALLKANDISDKMMEGVEDKIANPQFSTEITRGAEQPFNDENCSFIKNINLSSTMVNEVTKLDQDFPEIGDVDVMASGSLLPSNLSTLCSCREKAEFSMLKSSAVDTLPRCLSPEPQFQRSLLSKKDKRTKNAAAHKAKWYLSVSVFFCIMTVCSTCVFLSRHVCH